jgi:hypothetical protein
MTQAHAILRAKFVGVELVVSLDVVVGNVDFIPYLPINDLTLFQLALDRRPIAFKRLPPRGSTRS